MSEFAGIRRDALHAARAAREALSPRRRFENLLDRHEPRLRRVAYGMLGDANRVDDVLQEAFLKAYRALPDRFENDRAESAWLYRIVHRCCLDELRGRGRRREVAGAIELVAVHDDRDSSLVVAGALAQLSERSRAAILLVDLIGLDYDTAALVLRVPRGTIASRLNAARAQLRECSTGAGVSVELDDLVAPPARERLPRGAVGARRAARAARPPPVARARAHGGSRRGRRSRRRGCARVRTGPAVATATFDRTASCPVPIQGGVPVSSSTPRTSRRVLQRRATSAWSRSPASWIRTASPYAGLGRRRGRATASDFRASARPRRRCRSRPPACRSTTSTRRGRRGTADGQRRAVLRRRARDVRVHATIDRTTRRFRPGRDLDGQEAPPVAFVHWTPKRVVVYLSHDCRIR